MRHLAILAAFIAIPMMAQSLTIQPSSPAPATETRTFALKNGGNLKVSGYNGEVKVSGWDRDEVALTANFKASSDDDHVKIEVKSANDYLELIAKQPKNRNRFFGPRESGKCDMELKVPNRIVGEISTYNGQITIDSIAGKISMNTYNGKIVVENLSGNIKAKTYNGNINADILNIEDNLEMTTYNGNINVKLLNPNGEFSASTYNGNIKLQASGAKDIVVTKKNTRASFGNGNTKMKFRTYNGSILVQ